MDSCYTCKIEFRVEDIVVSCEAFCENQHSFHAKCVGLTYDEGCACLHSNIFWMCDSCKYSIENGRFKKSTTSVEESKWATKDDVQSLKLELERISKMISNGPSKSTDTAVPNVSEYHHAASSSPIVNFPLTSTKIIDQTPMDQRLTDNPNVQLFISNVANDVTVDEIKQMVCETIGADQVLDVKCLVSPWKHLSAYDYVSFKVVLAGKYRSSALTLSNWPTGIRCREFRDANPVWRPSYRTFHASV